MPSEALDRTEDRGGGQDDQHENIVRLHRGKTVAWKHLKSGLGRENSRSNSTQVNKRAVFASNSS